MNTYRIEIIQHLSIIHSTYLHSVKNIDQNNCCGQKPNKSPNVGWYFLCLLKNNIRIFLSWLSLRSSKIILIPKIVEFSINSLMQWTSQGLKQTASIPSSLGAVCIPIFLPLTVLFLISLSRSPDASVLQWPPSLPSYNQLLDPLAPVLLLGWIALHVLLYHLPCGKVRRD